MKTTVKRILSFLAIFCLLLSFASCDDAETSSTGIYSLTIEDLSDEMFYKDVISDVFEVSVESTSEYDESDISVFVKDESIIKIDFEKTDSLFSSYISFEITGLKEGTTSFYFETFDGIVQSNTVEVTVLQNITAISFSDTSEIKFYDWSNIEERFFSIESQEYISAPNQFFDFVSENPKVATIEYDEDSLLSDKCIITRMSAGETYVYIQTKDKSIQSEKIKVIVEEEETETESFSVEENSSINSNKNASNSSGSQSSNKQTGGSSQSGDASVIVPDHAESEGDLVWVPTNGGTKYHSKSSCSNMKDPIQISEETAINNGYTACKRCH